MLKEFFVPRLFFIFVVLWAIIGVSLGAWSCYSSSERKKFLTAAKIPLISAAASFVVTSLIMLFVTILN
jgi:hypothetical protein